MRRWLVLQVAGLALAAVAIWLFAGSALDFRLSALAYSPEARAFPLRDAWLAEAIGHKGLKHLSLALWLGLLGIASASRAWRGELLRSVLGVALAASAVSVLRGWSAHSCPWDLATFGGSAEWFPVFGEVPANPGPGRCLPSGHASTGFGLFALYFALREAHPRHALASLALAWALGLLATAVQVARGAHFLSHGLWTAWVCWAVCLALSVAWSWRKILRDS
ncbi:MAG TPA: phosphatase PAP2 family protein [Burkholderiales bacterium]|nr:phosphatase PAP2 family protein [Burkholderiales bacterium]